MLEVLVLAAVLFETVVLVVFEVVEFVVLVFAAVLFEAVELVVFAVVEFVLAAVEFVDVDVLV